MDGEILMMVDGIRDDEASDGNIGRQEGTQAKLRGD